MYRRGIACAELKFDIASFKVEYRIGAYVSVLIGTPTVESFIVHSEYLLKNMSFMSPRYVLPSSRTTISHISSLI